MILFKYQLRNRLKSNITLLLMICFGHLFIINTSGQTANDVDPEISENKQLLAPVKLDGKVVFMVQGISSYPSEVRAGAIAKRIKAVAANPSFATDSLKIVKGEDRNMIYAGKDFILSIYNVDAEREGVNAEILTKIFFENIRSAIDEYRLVRKRSELIKRAKQAAIAAILLGIVLAVVVYLTKRMNAALQKRIRSGIDSVEHKSFKLIKSAPLWKAINIFFKTVNILIIIAIIVLFIEYVLKLFPWTNNIATSVLDLFLQPLITVGKAIAVVNERLAPNAVSITFIAYAL